jgi:hypothetical protein
MDGFISKPVKADALAAELAAYALRATGVGRAFALQFATDPVEGRAPARP